MPDSYGYSCSPIAYKETVIVPAAWERIMPSDSSTHRNTSSVGSAGAAPHTLGAFDQVTGEVVWTAGRFTIGHSSPILINFDGTQQLVVYAKEGLFGVLPESGEIIWHHALSQENPSDAISTPLWNGKDLIYSASHNRNAGGRVIKLTRRDSRVETEQLWFSKKMNFGNVVPVQVGDYLVGATRSILVAADINTGRRKWAKRGFEGGVCIAGGDKLIVLDLNGKLGLATATPEGLTIHSTTQVLARVSLTPPTLVDDRLFVRDRQHVVALDLGSL
jgi:outer membrane protein assembly factor BamB